MLVIADSLMSLLSVPGQAMCARITADTHCEMNPNVMKYCTVLGNLVVSTKLSSQNTNIDKFSINEY